MAEESFQEKTEEPTSKREDEFREDGQVARSLDVNTLLLLVTALITLGNIGPKIGQIISASLQGAMTNRNDNIVALLTSWSKMYLYPVFGYLFIFFAVISVTSMAATLVQTGLVFSPKSIVPKFGNVNPVSGLGKLFSVRTIVQLLKNLLKVFIIGWIVYDQLNDKEGEFLMLSTLSLADAMTWTIQIIGHMVLRISLVLGTIAAGDYLYQWYSLKNKMRMTKQEVKDEMKESELPPHIKQKVRQIAVERSKKAIRNEVPKADVIITNPTHYAVAIKYMRFKDRAPRVVAKGQDFLAKMIREIAEENKVPFYEYPELARTLYRTVKVGRLVPAEMYESVARVLAFIFKLNKQRKQVRV
ncbi:MAG: hypothetical protein ACD_73C00814G0001 [uncultured bacterium]|nr:MAG: hypothetical protein ACD_73C00814G0001 [uncultured bacterium]